MVGSNVDPLLCAKIPLVGTPQTGPGVCLTGRVGPSKVLKASWINHGMGNPLLEGWQCQGSTLAPLYDCFVLV